MLKKRKQPVNVQGFESGIPSSLPVDTEVSGAFIIAALGIV